MRVLVVISYYDQRPADPLRKLLESMKAHEAGHAFDTLVVVNSEGGAGEGIEDIGIPIVRRANAGMNIGAWDHGWRTSPAHDAFLFLQDECEAARADWLGAYVARAQDNRAGLLGESMNLAWSKPWATIARERQGEVMPDHLIDGKPAQRVALYLDFMRRGGVDPGESGAHLRSLAWFARRDALERIGGFLNGASYGECIAAEIAASRAMIAAGYEVAQIAAAPFYYFRHADWAQTKPGGPFLHARSRATVRDAGP